MSRRQGVLLAILVAVAAAVCWLALRTRQPPVLPADATHAASLGAGPVQCLTCHGPGRPSPRGPNHPLGDDCFRCHGTRSS